MTATTNCHHIVILLQDNVLLVVEIQQADGLEVVRHAARRAHFTGELEGVHDGLHRGVVGCAEAFSQREWTGALAVVGVVAPRGDYPA